MPIDIDTLKPRLAAALGNDLQLGELLGSGGFAAVFRAHDPFLQRDVAIKVLDPALALSADLEEQFLREARIIAGAEHPHIVPLYSAESRHGLLYLVMRLLPGQALSDRIRTGKLPAPDAARLALETAQALAAAHANGVVHRDIKPDNILLDASGHATVTDFGISLVAARPADRLAGATAGTPRYMSPEQAMGEDVDGRSDVYSLGVVLFELLTGRLPFEGRNATELIAKHISASPPKVSEIEPQTPTALVALVERMLEKSPSKRPDSAELVTLLTEANTPEKLMSPRAVTRRRWRKRSAYIGVALVSAALVIWGAVRVAGGIIGVLMEPGVEPALLMTGQIPVSISAMARAEGSLRDGERVTLAFIPATHTAADALLLTDDVLIRRSTAGYHRIELKDAKFDIARRGGVDGATAQGFFIVTPKGERPETLFRNLSSVEAARLTTALGVWARVQRDSSPRARGVPK